MDYTQELNIAGLLAGMMVLLLVSLAIGAIFYILSAIGLSKIAKKMNHPSPWLAWIPIASSYLLGELAKDEIKKAKNITTQNFLYDNLGIILAVTPFAIGPVAIIPILGWLAAIGANILMIYLTCLCTYHIFKQFVGTGNAAAYVVLHIFLAPVALLIISSKDIIYPNEFTLRHSTQYQYDMHNQ
jgi:hypothetical protein